MSLLSLNLIKLHTKNLLNIIGNHILGKLTCVCFLAKPKLHSLISEDSTSFEWKWVFDISFSMHSHRILTFVIEGSPCPPVSNLLILHTFVIFLFPTRLTWHFFVLLKSSPQDLDICCCYRSPRKKALSIFMISKIAKREICVLLWLKI